MAADMSLSPVSMPGNAAAARSALADHYERETLGRLELARFAHERGLKSAFQHLMQLAGRSRKIAQTARQMEGLHDVMTAHIAGGQVPPSEPQASAPALPPASPPQYAVGTGAHPGGPAIVGEQGPEAATMPGQPPMMVGQSGPQVANLPAGTTVAPNILTIIRMLLDVYQAQQDQGGPPPMDDGGGDVQDLETTPVPRYAFGTSGTSVFGKTIATPQQNYSGPNPLGFLDEHGHFKGTQGLQDIQLANAGAGNYDPMGNPAIAQLAKTSILGSTGARQAQAAKVADLYAGGDPAFRAYARLKASTDTASEAARAYEGAAVDQANRGQAFGQNVYMNTLGAVTRKDPKQPNPLAEIGGQVLGAGIGAIPWGGGKKK